MANEGAEDRRKKNQREPRRSVRDRFQQNSPRLKTAQKPLCCSEIL
jgi:hypothetical protein